MKHWKKWYLWPKCSDNYIAAKTHETTFLTWSYLLLLDDWGKSFWEYQGLPKKLTRDWWWDWLLKQSLAKYLRELGMNVSENVWDWSGRYECVLGKSSLALTLHYSNCDRTHFKKCCTNLWCQYFHKYIKTQRKWNLYK